ncbi:esterase/lipase family protein [Arthrobacter sp. SA17]
MAVFVLIHGGGSTAWDWHLVRPLLEASGHDAIAVDLPIEDENAGLEDYIRAVTAAVGDAQHTIVVGHSLGALRPRWFATSSNPMDSFISQE